MLKSLFNEVAGLEVCDFIKRDSTQLFSSEICEISKNTYLYFKEDLRTTASICNSISSINFFFKEV